MPTAVKGCHAHHLLHSHTLAQADKPYVHSPSSQFQPTSLHHSCRNYMSSMPVIVVICAVAAMCVTSVVGPEPAPALPPGQPVAAAGQQAAKAAVAVVALGSPTLVATAVAGAAALGAATACGKKRSNASNGGAHRKKPRSKKRHHQSVVSAREFFHKTPARLLNQINSARHHPRATQRQRKFRPRVAISRLLSRTDCDSDSDPPAVNKASSTWAMDPAAFIQAVTGGDFVFLALSRPGRFLVQRYDTGTAQATVGYECVVDSLVGGPSCTCDKFRAELVAMGEGGRTGLLMAPTCVHTLLVSQHSEYATKCLINGDIVPLLGFESHSALALSKQTPTQHPFAVWDENDSAYALVVVTRPKTSLATMHCTARHHYRCICAEKVRTHFLHQGHCDPPGVKRRRADLPSRTYHETNPYCAINRDKGG